MNFNQPFTLKTDQKDDVISVSQLNKIAKNTLENYLPIMWIKGEISGLKAYAHLYFDLKDEGGKVSCVMFSKLLAMLDFNLENGTQVEVRGKVTIYPQNGSYQINVERIRKVGLGELWEAYSKLIVKLREEGLFEPHYKKPIPIFPRSIGVITSKEGSVIRDVITTLKRRMPNIQIVIYHSAVQGMDAAPQIVKAIRTANCRNEVDVLIVCRGGGSMEDLWCFNEEMVAREVFSSQIPIISAVGHETDTTIIDFVSDLRAPTPTAAAEIVAKSRDEWLNLVESLEFNLVHWLNNLINDQKQRLDLARAHLKALNPIQRLSSQQQKLEQLSLKLVQAISHQIKQLEWQLNSYQSQLQRFKFEIKPLFDWINQLELGLSRSVLTRIKNLQAVLTNYEVKLHLLNPSSILTRGYAIVQDSSGHIIKNVKQAKHHSKVTITLSDGKLAAIIDKSKDPEQTELI